MATASHQRRNRPVNGQTAARVASNDNAHHWSDADTIRKTFDPWRQTRQGTSARRITEEVMRRIDALKPRVRQRKAIDAEIFAAIVDALVANLLRRHLALPAGCDPDAPIQWANVSLSARRLNKSVQSRYETTPVPLKSLPKRIHEMESLGFIILDKAPQYHGTLRRSRIRAGTSLVDLIEIHRPQLDHLDTARTPVDGNKAAQEVIVLRRRVDAFEGPGFGWKQSHNEDVDYQDDDQTEKWRREVETINAFLADADISFDRSVSCAPANGIPLYERSLRRIFNNERWGHGGRLYGGFWQTMPRDLRTGLRIEGRRVVTLDYSSMFLQLLYAIKAGKQAPLTGDLYECIDPIDGWPEDLVSRTTMRDAIKRNVNALLFAKRKAGKTHRLVKGTKPTMTKGLDGIELERRIKERHPEVAQWLGTEVGFELMHHESEIMIDVALRCMKKGVVVLPLHDGLLVGDNHMEAARERMHIAFHDYTQGFGARIRLALET